MRLPRIRETRSPAGHRHTHSSYRAADADLVPMAWTDPWEPSHRQIIDLWMEIARAKGYLIHVFQDSRGEHWGADSGWPDLFLVRSGRAYAIEVKVPPDTATEEQIRWLGALGRIPGISEGIFRSSGDRARDMAVIAGILDTSPPTLPRAEVNL